MSLYHRIFGTLARYIAARFVRSISMVFMLCLVLIYMIDFLELLRSAGKVGKISIAAIAWITMLRLPSFAELTLPFAILGGSIGAFLSLTRTSELVITRAGGMSVWQLVLPGMLVAGTLGASVNYVYSPVAAAARAEAERVFAQAYGEEMSLISGDTAGWLRQDSPEGPSLIHAGASADQGLALTGVRVLRYDKEHRFIESMTAKKADLRDGYWELAAAFVSKPGESISYRATHKVSTYLTPVEVRQVLGSTLSLSYHQIPVMIQLAEKAGLKATALKVQYASMQSRPFIYAVMVLLAATVALKSFRFGNVQRRVAAGVVGGFGLFILTEVSRQLGATALISPETAAWVPTAVAGLMAIGVLLHQEDG